MFSSVWKQKKHCTVRRNCRNSTSELSNYILNALLRYVVLWFQRLRGITLPSSPTRKNGVIISILSSIAYSQVGRMKSGQISLVRFSCCCSLSPHPVLYFSKLKPGFLVYHYQAESKKLDIYVRLLLSVPFSNLFSCHCVCNTQSVLPKTWIKSFKCDE